MKKMCQAAALLLPGVLAFPSAAAPLPLWEVGAGLGVISVPDYRGSDVRNNYVLPVPYLIYRGKVLKADRNGVRAALFYNDALEVNLSLNGTLPANSKDNPLRRGMADLKPTVEVGPTVDFNLWHSGDSKKKLDLRLPARAAITLQSSPTIVGWLFSPNLSLNVRDPAGMAGWKGGLSGGPIFATRRYNGYFYSVAQDEAITGRPAYAAPGGYAGTQVTASLSKRFSRYWVGTFLRYDNLSGAVFSDSPLLQRHSALSAGIAVSWVFGASSTLVEASE
ncbi:MAG TPA: MipA/OmpV family protein [Burkholderiaceae bacterium]|nr:MipA/OmpV family protein [Burkholderiaceae bacterium]